MINRDLFVTPSFIIDRVLLRRNLEVLDSVHKRTGAKILLALKGFAMYSTFGLVREYLHGICASSPHEAKLGRDDFGREVHSFAAAYSEKDFIELAELSDHIVINSMSQYERFLPLLRKYSESVEFGLRINPEHRETAVEMYDPCAPFSRLGITRKNFPDALPEHISGLHFHTLCQQNSDALARTVMAAEASFGEFFHKCRWVNFGGGHHITREDYDIDLLCEVINNFRAKYDVQVYLEPGEAVALNAGFLLSQVLDIVDNGMKIAIMDTSAAAHMPDVIEMPYRPHVIGAGAPGEFGHTYRLTGLSCLAGDVIGDYSFREPLVSGNRLLFTDMAIYSMVKTNTFNGIKLPDIYYYDSDKDQILHWKSFSYDDFRSRLS